MLLEADMCRVKPLNSTPTQIEGSRGIYTCGDLRLLRFMRLNCSQLLSQRLLDVMYNMIYMLLIGRR